MASTSCAAQQAGQSSDVRLAPAPGGSDTDVGAAVLAFQAGDVGALATLTARFERMMRAVARRYVRCHQDVDDAVQDAWVAFARTAHRIETPMAIGGWLRVTTARAALTIAQRQARCIPTEFRIDVDLAAAATDPGADELDDDEREAVRDAVRRLSGHDQQLLSMLFVSELSYRQIGARTGRPVGSIGPTRKRVIGKLRKDRSIKQLAAVRAS